MPYHKISSLMITSGKRPPVFLDESMAVVGRYGQVGEAVRDMRRARQRVRSVLAFVPTSDLSSVKRVVVVSGHGDPDMDGDDLLVSPELEPEPLLRFFGKIAYERLDDKNRARWTTIFQSDANSGRRVVLASDPVDRFVESYASFQVRPKELRDRSEAMYGFFENLYGKRSGQWMRWVE